MCRFNGVVPRTINYANHGGKITGAVVSAGKLKTVGFDDKLRTASIATHTYDQPEIALPGQPIRSGRQAWARQGLEDKGEGGREGKQARRRLPH